MIARLQGTDRVRVCQIAKGPSGKGAALTYARRYTLFAAGIACDNDLSLPRCSCS